MYVENIKHGGDDHAHGQLWIALNVTHSMDYVASVYRQTETCRN